MSPSNMARIIGAEVVAEYRFHPPRMWRFDYAIPSHRIAIEVEGGVWTNGRHIRGTGFLNDMEKYNQAVLDGWRLLRCTPDGLLGVLMLAQQLMGKPLPADSEGGNTTTNNNPQDDGQENDSEPSKANKAGRKQ